MLNWTLWRVLNWTLWCTLYFSWVCYVTLSNINYCTLYWHIMWLYFIYIQHIFPFTLTATSHSFLTIWSAFHSHKCVCLESMFRWPWTSPLCSLPLRSRRACRRWTTSQWQPAMPVVSCSRGFWWWQCLLPKQLVAVPKPFLIEQSPHPLSMTVCRCPVKRQILEN